MTKHLLGLAVGLLAFAPTMSSAQELAKRLLEAEQKRVEAINKVRPSVVAIFGKGGAGGGSGVLIDEEGYALTNFHVVSGAGAVMKCGLDNGILYDAVLVGLDKVGDVALIKLLPKKKGDKFPFAPMGDSDTVRAGDWSLAMGNPFLLATDFTPTVTYGLISGVHRYQYPAGTLLEYTDCIQIDTSINPGNSGGPLYNMDGEIIGINGRGSFEKRGRVNSGVGYAISINQIKNFLPHMRAGLDTDHASLGASVESDQEDDILDKLRVTGIIPSDALRRGLDVGDQLLGFGKIRRLASVNEFKNILGLYPRGWRVPMSFRHNGEKRQVLVRLMGIQKRELNPGGAKPKPGRKPPTVKHPMYEAKKGFANYYFNKQELERLTKSVAEKMGDFSSLKGTWEIEANGRVLGKRTAGSFSIRQNGSEDGNNDIVRGIVDGLVYRVVPLDPKTELLILQDPPKSGGLMVALYQLRQLLVYGAKGFVGSFTHGGMEPWYLPTPVGEQPDYEKQRIFCEVIRTQHAGVEGKWYFGMDDKNRHLLVGAEIVVDKGGDPCEIYFLDHKEEDGRMLPKTMIVKHADDTYARFENVRYEFKK